MIRTRNIPFLPVAGADADADTFIAAAQLTNTTHIRAVRQLVYDFKSSNVWNKLKAVYPMVGGNANAHKFNLKDARDMDAAYRLNFYNNSLHSATGVKWDTTSHADTHLIPSAHLVASSHISYYSRDVLSQGGDVIDMGASNQQLQSLLLSVSHPVGGIVTRHCGNYISIADTKNGKGWYVTTSENVRQQSTVYVNGNVAGVNPATDGTMPSISIFLGALNINGNSYGGVNRECAFATIGDGITATEATSMYNAIQSFQTTLGRQV